MQCAQCQRFEQDCPTSGWCNIAFDLNIRDPVLGRTLLTDTCQFFKPQKEDEQLLD